MAESAKVELVNKTRSAIMHASLVGEDQTYSTDLPNLVEVVLNSERGVLAECSAGAFRVAGTFHDEEIFISSEVISFAENTVVTVMVSDDGVSVQPSAPATKSTATPHGYSKVMGPVAKSK